MQHRQSNQEAAYKAAATAAAAAVAAGEIPVEQFHRQPRSLDERFHADVSEWKTYSVGGFPLTREQFQRFTEDRAAMVAFLKDAATRQWTHSPQFCGCRSCQDRSGYRRTLEFQLSRGITPSAKLLALANG